MTLLTLYLQFFNSGSAWTVYAARNQALSGVECSHNAVGNGTGKATATCPPSATPSHSETLQEWTERKIFWTWYDRNH